MTGGFALFGISSSGLLQQILYTESPMLSSLCSLDTW